MKKFVPQLARVLYGLVFFVFGLNGFLNFIPQPPHPGNAGAFLGALAATGYMFPLIKGTETLAGLLLLTNRYVPLALTLLAPVVLNIVLFHTLLDPSGAVFALALLALGLYLAWTRRSAYAGLFHAKEEAPASSPKIQTREVLAAE